MALFSAQDAEFLRKKFADELTDTVTLRLFTMRSSPLIVPGRECATCEETEAILTELSELSEHIALEQHDFYAESEQAQAAGIARIPATAIAADGNDRTVFYGIPSGYEFATLVEMVLDAGTGAGRLTEETVQALAAVDKSIHLQVFVTPT